MSITPPKGTKILTDAALVERPHDYTGFLLSRYSDKWVRSEYRAGAGFTCLVADVAAQDEEQATQWTLTHMESGEFKLTIKKESLVACLGPYRFYQLVPSTEPDTEKTMWATVDMAKGAEQKR